MSTKAYFEAIASHTQALGLEQESEKAALQSLVAAEAALKAELNDHVNAGGPTQAEFDALSAQVATLATQVASLQSLSDANESEGTNDTANLDPPAPAPAATVTDTVPSDVQPPAADPTATISGGATETTTS